MDLNIKHDIDSNVFSTSITVSGFGSEDLSEQEEKDILANFPIKITYRSLAFSKNIKIDGNVPVVTDEPADDSTIVAVTLPPLSNKEIAVDETFNAVYKIDTAKIANSDIDATVLTTKELVAQAYCTVFDAVITGAVKELIDEVRRKAPMFEGETIVSI